MLYVYFYASNGAVCESRCRKTATFTLPDEIFVKLHDSLIVGFHLHVFCSFNLLMSPSNHTSKMIHLLDYSYMSCSIKFTPVDMEILWLYFSIGPPSSQSDISLVPYILIVLDCASCISTYCETFSICNHHRLYSHQSLLICFNQCPNFACSLNTSFHLYIGLRQKSSPWQY